MDTAAKPTLREALCDLIWISDSPVAFECITMASVITGPCQTVVIGRVLAVHIAVEFVLDPKRGYVDTTALHLVARSYGSDYIRTGDTFALARPIWADRKTDN